MDALGPKLGSADYQLVADDIRKKLRSSTRAAEKFPSYNGKQPAPRASSQPVMTKKENG